MLGAFARVLWSAKQLGLSTAEFKRRGKRAMWGPSELPEAVRDTAGWDWTHQAADRAIRRARWLLWLPLLVQGFVLPIGGQPAIQALFPGRSEAPAAGFVVLSTLWCTSLLAGCSLSLGGAIAIGMTLEFGRRSLVRVAWLGALGAGLACACAALAGVMELRPGWSFAPTRSLSLLFCAGVAAVDALAAGATLYALLRHAPALADIDAAIAAHSPLPAR